MTEMVSSAVVQEGVSKIVSSVLSKKDEISSAEEHMERLEMAHIKLEAALQASQKWHITDASLLRWQKKLKRVAQECDETLLKCRQHLQGQEVRKSSSFPKRAAHATKSLIFSIFYGNNEEFNRFAVRRFEWFADGASEFLRFVEFGGTPHQYTFFHPLTKHLLAGKTLEYKSVWANKHHLFRIRPFKNAECRIEARLIFQYKDTSAPEDNYFFTLMLQLLESTDIVGIAIKCLQLFTPRFESTAEIVKKELTQLPSQDFSWVPYVYSCHREHRENLYNISSQWFRPNPLCCKQHGQYKGFAIGNTDMLELSDTSLEPVIHVYLESHVALSEYDKQTKIINRKRSSSQDSTHLKLGLIFVPHDSSEDLLPKVRSSVTELTNGEKQHCLHTNITLQQLNRIMLPKAIDCLHRNAEMTTYQMIWKSKHGSAYLHVEKKSMPIMSRRRTIRGARNEMLFQRHDQELNSRTADFCAFLNSWVVHAPIQLQGSIMDWIQKEKETQLAKNGNGVVWGTM